MVTRHRLLPLGLAVALLSLGASIASAAELQLAGVRLGRSALTILQKYGNPTEVRVGQASQTPGESPNVSVPQMNNPMSGLPGMEGLPGMMPDMGGSPAMPQPGGPVVQRRGPPEVIWLYRFPKNKTLEFIVSPDGRVMQITAFGVEWPNVRTAKGIGFGNTYKDLLAKYGFPESHDQSGVALVVRYPDRHRAIFTLVGQQIVGITIGLMD